MIDGITNSSDKNSGLQIPNSRTKTSFISFLRSFALTQKNQNVKKWQSFCRTCRTLARCHSGPPRLFVLTLCLGENLLSQTKKLGGD
jgi:hypothetical protein